MLTTILLVFSFVLLVCSSLGFNPPRPHLGWLGVALFVLAYLLAGHPGLG